MKEITSKKIYVYTFVCIFYLHINIFAIHRKEKKETKKYVEPLFLKSLHLHATLQYLCKRVKTGQT